MSDSFADLWASSAPANPQNVPLSQQKRPPPTSAAQRPAPDVFSMLAQTSSGPRYGASTRTLSPALLNASNAAPRSITPSYSGSNGVARPASSLSTNTTTSSNNGDAFGDLFSSATTSSANTANLTIAQRAALAQKQTLAPQASAAKSTPVASQWAGLDALGAGSFTSNSSKPAATKVDHDDWGLGDFGTAPTKPTARQSSTPAATAINDTDDWGLGDFGAALSKPPAPTSQPTSQPATQAASGSFWDIDDFHAPPKVQETVNSPDEDFDFGNREDGVPNSATRLVDRDDDILGMLSKPVETVRSQQQRQASVRNQSPPPRPQRSSSPPPHIIGQIVEMGFSVAQAKTALARTETGTDVQAALDMLLGESNRSDTPPSERQRPDRNGYSEAAPPRRRPAPPQREGSSSGSATPNAEKLLAQASEIGLSVFNKASLFWKEGKEKVQKAYVEASASSGSAPRDSRPRWMQEAAGDLPRRQSYERPGGSSFKDDEDHHGSTSAFVENGWPSGYAPPPPEPRQRQPEPDLFSSAEPAEPKVYVSPFRRKKVEPARAPAASAPPPAAAKPKPKRRLPFCPASTLTRVSQHKTKGTNAFKLGQFSVAVEEYTKGIDLLPAGHLLLVPLSTNRAIASTRCGECKTAIEDTGKALAIIALQSGKWESWHPTDEDGGWELEDADVGSDPDGRGGYTMRRNKGAEWSDTWGRGVDLKDGWVKAVKRRAEAYEGLEKWKEARKDWEILAGGGGGGWVDAATRQEAVRGIGRCKKMIEGPAAGEANGSQASNGRPAAAPSAVKPRPKVVPVAVLNAKPSGEAVKAYRAQVDAAEAEDAMKHSLKDSVEEKLMTWKKGKETNLRALLSSLDTILWEEVLKDMGKAPGIADLISAGGVKKWYMKAVSRVHPDKLNANNSTLEQRMIAGGVFGALNEAWLAFKA